MVRIARRHRRAGDDDPLLFSDDPRDLQIYLRRLPDRWLLGDDLSHDVTDALTIRLWLWWEGEAFELRILEAAERLKLRRRLVGEVLGIRTGQGVIDRTDRKRALFGPEGRPDEKIARAARRPPEPQPEPEPDPLWSFVLMLAARRDELPEDLAGDVGWLLAELTPDHLNMPAHVRTLAGDVKDAGIGGDIGDAALVIAPRVEASPLD